MGSARPQGTFGVGRLWAAPEAGSLGTPEGVGQGVSGLLGGCGMGLAEISTLSPLQPLTLWSGVSCFLRAMGTPLLGSCLLNAGMSVPFLSDAPPLSA